MLTSGSSSHLIGDDAGSKNPRGNAGVQADFAQRPPLVASVCPVAGIDAPTIDAMYRLFSGNYDDVERQLFERDLLAKSHVVFVHDPSGTMRGFSTLVIWEMERSSGPVRLLFSGDTVIEPSFWGDRSFLIKWLETTGALYAEQPSVPLYWLLISMSPRTYRALPLFFRRYYPSPAGHHSIALLAAEVGQAFFPERFDASRGLIVAAHLTGRLAPPLAVVPAKDRRRPEVQFFLSRNPAYADGDELICLARIQPTNIRAGMRRYFERGSAGGMLP
jgi:hypothetical protein